MLLIYPSLIFLLVHFLCSSLPLPCSTTFLFSHLDFSPFLHPSLFLSLAIYSPTPTYCSDPPPLSVREAKAGRQGMRFVFLCTPPHIVSLLPPPALLLVAWQVRHSIEINHLRDRCACVCVCERARVCMCAWTGEARRGFLMVVMGVLLWARPQDYHPVECMCVLLMPLAMTCPHCYQCDLCSPPPHCAFSFLSSSCSFRRFALFSALCLGCSLFFCLSRCLMMGRGYCMCKFLCVCVCGSKP